MDIRPTFVVTIINDESDGNLAANELSLREAIEQAKLTGAPDQITFDAGLSGSTLRLTQGELQITRAVTIDGDLDNDNAPDIIITGDANANDSTDAAGITNVFATSLASLADNSRIFNVNAASASAASIFDTAIPEGSGIYRGQLSDNGGIVQTIALNTNPSNAALDSAIGALPADTGDIDNDGNKNEPTPFDSRGVGFDRVFGSGADLGAFEVQATVVGPTPLDDVLIGTANADLIDGLAGNDTISGLEDGDLLYGRSGNDILNGDAGDDNLNGGLGADLLNGGTGID